MEKVNLNLSTAKEIKNRRCTLFGGPTKVFESKPSTLIFISPYEENKVDYRDTLIVIFVDGSQANMTQEEFDKL